jgi:hypothetical protein
MGCAEMGADDDAAVEAMHRESFGKGLTDKASIDGLLEMSHNPISLLPARCAGLRMQAL